MTRLMLATAAAALLVGACDSGAGEQAAPAADPAATADAPTGALPDANAAPAAAAMPTATGPGTAMGLTGAQLEDADLRDATGRDLGDVERVVADGAGNVTALLVEIDDTEPDRYVELALEGLEAVREPDDDDGRDDDWDLRADLTREALMAMPEARR